MYLGNLAGLLIVLTCVPFFAAILRVPFSIIAPIIIVICAIGSYTVHNAMLDIWYMLLFGVVGYLFKKLDYPLAPMVLALVLGDRAEDSFRQTMLMSQGDVRIFYSNWLVGGITGLALVLLFWPLISRVIGGCAADPERCQTRHDFRLHTFVSIASTLLRTAHSIKLTSQTQLTRRT
jgi:putative tricarboxylic transport membrane protein